MDQILHRLKKPLASAALLVLLTMAASLAGCGSSATPSNADPVSTQAAGTSAPLARSTPVSVVSSESSYLLFNQRFIEGTSKVGLDLDDVDAVFWKVFSGLPDAVTVYPSENY
jgi:ABC-type uncharacterized transport system auxiliary subunit